MVAQDRPSVGAPKESLSVCGLSVQLLAKQDKVLALFADSQGCELSKQQSSDTKSLSYFLVAKGHQEIVRGQLDFIDGNLVSVSREWNEDINDEISFAQVIIGLLHRFEAEGHADCKIQTSQLSEPNIDSKRATIHCGLKSLGILLAEYRGKKSIQIDETLGI